MHENCCIFIGHLASNVEYTRYALEDRSRAVGRLIVNRVGNNNEYDVIPFVAWDRYANVLKKFSKKGKEVTIRGAMRTNSVKSEDGTYSNYFELEIHYLSLGQEAGEPTGKPAKKVGYRRGKQ